MTVTGDSEVKRRSGQSEDLFTLKPGVYFLFLS